MLKSCLGCGGYIMSSGHIDPLNDFTPAYCIDCTKKFEAEKRKIKPVAQYTVTIDFAHQVQRTFCNLNKLDVDLFRAWLAGGPAILSYTYCNDIYYLNREFVCTMIIEEVL
jgi:hypothetical protein